MLVGWGNQHRRLLGLQHIANGGRYDPMAAWHMASWLPVQGPAQSVGIVGGGVHGGGGDVDEWAELRAEREAADILPDGIVPPELVWALQEVGLKSDEARGTAAMVVAAVTEAVSEAEHSWERLWQQHEEEIGVPVVIASRGTAATGGVCSACREQYSRLYWVDEFAGPAARALLHKCSMVYAASVPGRVMPPRRVGGEREAGSATVTARRATLAKAARVYAEHAGVTVCHLCAQQVVCERYVQYDPVGVEAKQRATAKRDRVQSGLDEERQRVGKEHDGLRQRSGSITRAVSASSSGGGTEEGSEDAQRADTVGRGGHEGWVDLDRDGKLWVASYGDMTPTERNKYIGEERVRVCADENNEMLHGASREQIRAADMCPAREAHMTATVVSGVRYMIVHSSRERGRGNMDWPVVCTGWSRRLETEGRTVVGVEPLYGSSLRQGSTCLRVDVSEIEELSRMARLGLGEWRSVPQGLDGDT